MLFRSKINHPPIVIAKPIPTSSGQTSEIPTSEQTSAPPPPSEPAVTFSESRKKAVARKRAKKDAASTEPAEGEEKTPSDQPEQETTSVQVEEEIPSVQAIPILKEVKLEIEDMTAMLLLAALTYLVLLTVALSNGLYVGPSILYRSMRGIKVGYDLL